MRNFARLKGDTSQDDRGQNNLHGRCFTERFTNSTAFYVGFHKHHFAEKAVVCGVYLYLSVECHDGGFARKKMKIEGEKV